MTAKKRDQQQYDLIQQYLPDLILNTILGIIHELGGPYVAKPGRGGMTAYPPIVMGIVCIMLEAERTTYRKMVGMLRNNHAMTVKMHGDCTRCRRPDKGDLDPCHMLQHRARSQVTGKGRQAHTGPNRNTSSVTGASCTVPFLAEPSHRVLDLGDFMGCGGTWRNVVYGNYVR